jgi:S1-C subfamily serine protease
MAAIAKIRRKVQNIEHEMVREEKQMVNKVIIGIVALALVIAGAAGAYTFYLGEQLAASQEQQTAEISTLRYEMIAQGEETLVRIDTLDSELKGIALGMEQSFINAAELYQETSQGIVRISDGEKVLGSGFAFDAEGHILTPQHVAEGQNPIYIISADGHTSPATIIGTCEYSDIAVLKHSLSIPALTLTDSAEVNIGQPIVVIGHPLALPGTITSGIVSQTNRTAEVLYDSKSRGVANLIQLDAAVNFGNSGSPLLNSKGEVIGMIIARIDPNVGEGAYFAVSSNKLQRVTRSLIERGSFDYPWLGVTITNLTPETAIARKLETVNGALVKTVIAATPAEAAGIKVDDIIVAINGTSFQEAADLICYLGEYASPGDGAILTLIRNGAKIELPLTVGKR